MTREARIMSGIILITVPTIQYGGYFLLTSLMDRASRYMDNPLSAEFLSRGPRACGRDRAAGADLPGAGGRLSASTLVAVANTDRSAAGGDPDPRRILSLHALSGRGCAQSAGHAHLCGCGSACFVGRGTRYWTPESGRDELGQLRRRAGAAQQREVICHPESSGDGRSASLPASREPALSEVEGDPSFAEDGASEG